MTDTTQALLNERGKTHGSFASNAYISQHLKQFYRSQPGYGNLNAEQREALDMFAAKICRILSGQPDFNDHWDDIAGYARLASAACKK